MTVQDEVITSAPFPFLTEELILEKVLARNTDQLSSV